MPSLARHERTRSEVELFKVFDRMAEENNYGIRNTDFSNQRKQNRLLSKEKNTRNKRRTILAHDFVKSSSQENLEPRKFCHDNLRAGLATPVLDKIPLNAFQSESRRVESRLKPSPINPLNALP